MTRKNQQRAVDALSLAVLIVMILSNLDQSAPFQVLAVCVLVLAKQLGQQHLMAGLIRCILAVLSGLGLIVLGGMSLMGYPFSWIYPNAWVGILGFGLVLLMQLYCCAVLKPKRQSSILDVTLIGVLLYNLIGNSLALNRPDYAEGSSLGISGVVIGAGLLLWCGRSALLEYTETASIRQGYQVLRQLAVRHRFKLVTLSMVKDILLSLGKLVMGIVGFSLFMVVNAAYSFCFGYARHTVRSMQNKTYAEQLAMYLLLAKIIMVLGVAYLVYTIRLFSIESQEVYPMNLALLIALYTFVEFYLDIREIVRLRKKNDLLNEALRYISLSSTWICFALTQTAIMSFSGPADPAFSNALSGLFFGFLVVVTGLLMYMKGRRRRISLLAASE